MPPAQPSRESEPGATISNSDRFFACTGDVRQNLELALQTASPDERARIEEALGVIIGAGDRAHQARMRELYPDAPQASSLSPHLLELHTRKTAVLAAITECRTLEDLKGKVLRFYLERKLKYQTPGERNEFNQYTVQQISLEGRYFEIALTKDSLLPVIYERTVAQGGDSWTPVSIDRDI